MINEVNINLNMIYNKYWDYLERKLMKNISKSPGPKPKPKTPTTLSALKGSKKDMLTTNYK